MGADRSMGPGWLMVDAEGLATEQQLTDWIEVALQHHRAATWITWSGSCVGNPTTV